jgi:hypothetical protein
LFRCAHVRPLGGCRRVYGHDPAHHADELCRLVARRVRGGVYLGRAAVSEINPIYYSTPEPRFHADLVPYRASAAAGYRAGDLSQANLDQALGRGCVNCLTYPEEVILVHRGQADKYVPGGAEVAAEPAVAAAVEHQPSPEFASVERYTAFPIAAEPEPAELAGSDAAEAEVSLAAAD